MPVSLGFALFRTWYITSYLSLFTHSTDKSTISFGYWLELKSYASVVDTVFWPDTRGSVMGLLLGVARLAPYQRGCGIGRLSWLISGF